MIINKIFKRGDIDYINQFEDDIADLRECLLIIIK